MKILATNSDVGGVGAMAPALQRLLGDGHCVESFGDPKSLGFKAFAEAGLVPYPLEPAPSFNLAVRDFLVTHGPDVVVVGIAQGDEGTEKSVLLVALGLGIPVVVVLETWPDLWLREFVDNKKRGEVELYNRASAICVPDHYAEGNMIRHGFFANQIFETGNPEWDLLAEFRTKRDQYRTEKRGKWGISEKDFLILFAVTNQLDDPKENRPDAPSWLGMDEEDVILEFLGAVRDCSRNRHGLNQNRVSAAIRQKPGYGTNHIKELMGQIPGAILDVQAYECGWPSILAADLVIGGATLVLPNAALLGVPAVCVGPFYDSQMESFASNKNGLTVSVYDCGWIRKAVFTAAKMGNKEGLLNALGLQAKKVELIPNATENVAKVIIATAKKA